MVSVEERHSGLSERPPPVGGRGGRWRPLCRRPSQAASSTTAASGKRCAGLLILSKKERPPSGRKEAVRSATCVHPTSGWDKRRCTQRCCERHLTHGKKES